MATALEPEDQDLWEEEGILMVKLEDDFPVGRSLSHRGMTPLETSHQNFRRLATRKQPAHGEPSSDSATAVSG